MSRVSRVLFRAGGTLVCRPARVRTASRSWSGAALLLAAAGFLFACRSTPATNREAPAAADPVEAPAAPEAKIALKRGRVMVPGGRSFDVEVVEDPVAVARGLQHRAKLPPGQGMLFVFPSPSRHRFWMSECLIPLDIIWMDANRTVIHVEENAPICAQPPCPDYGPDADALYVLEVGAGVSRQAGIRLGTRLTLLFDHRPNPT